MLSVWRSHKWEPLVNNFTKDYKIFICVKQYPPESSCPIYWTYILYSLLQFEHMWRINLLVIIYINTSTIDF